MRSNYAEIELNYTRRRVAYIRTKESRSNEMKAGGSATWELRARARSRCTPPSEKLRARIRGGNANGSARGPWHASSS